MALSLKARKKLALLILVIGVPIYIVVAVNVIDWYNAHWGRLPIWGELLVFIGLGLLWAIPCKKVFLGVGQADPNETERQD